jgi:hypothetical protein
MADNQSRMHAALARVRDRHAKAERTIVEVRAERLVLYRQARDMNMTWEEIGASAGVTAAAVQQAVLKADNPRPHGRPGRPPGPRPRTGPKA